jgi:hypothetical protein
MLIGEVSDSSLKVGVVTAGKSRVFNGRRSGAIGTG